MIKQIIQWNICKKQILLYGHDMSKEIDTLAMKKSFP